MCDFHDFHLLIVNAKARALQEVVEAFLEEMSAEGFTLKDLVLTLAGFCEANKEAVDHLEKAYAALGKRE